MTVPNSALADFKDAVPQDNVDPQIAALPKEARVALGGPENMLTDEEIGKLLTLAVELSKWYEDLQEYALQAILKGKSISGYKAVEGKSNRVFKDQKTAFAILREHGYTDEQLFTEPKEKTLAALEKEIGKKEFAKLLGDQITKPRGNPTLVAETDKRAPYNSAAADFAEVAKQ